MNHRIFRRFLTTKRNAGRYNERIVPVGYGGDNGDGNGDRDDGGRARNHSGLESQGPLKRLQHAHKRRGKQLGEVEKDHGSKPEPQRVFVGNEIKTSKYTLLTFLPRNLFEQFRRVANFYFLIVSLIQLSIDSPVSPYTSVFPLILVVSVTMFKQAYEDFKRHRADAVINDKKILVVKNGDLIEKNSKQIEVGDILCIQEGEEFPCDLVLLSTSVANGKANVMTANLDGETNLKVHSAPIVTRHLKSPSALTQLQANIECENPNADLHRFVGRLRMLNQGYEKSRDFRCVALGPENVVLRGTQLKNTDFSYGCTVYTGRDTKMSLNSRMMSNKFSTVEHSLNRYLLFFIALMLVEVIICIIFKYYVGIDSPNNSLSVPWYLAKEDIPIDSKQVLQDFFSFVVLFNYIIPISLYVTLEMQKFIGSMFFIWDLDLYNEELDQPAKCNTSDLNEELGQVEYLFSDKTGTLTENIMAFKECSIEGVQYHDEQHQRLRLSNPGGKHASGRKIRRFLESLSLCHTVEATGAEGFFVNPNDIIYSASSPDEKALVEACRHYGIAFLGEREAEDGLVTVRLQVTPSQSLESSHRQGQRKVKDWQRLQVLEFDSDRKCMSVIVKDTKGRILLITKGAESSVFPKCGKGAIELTADHIHQYALVGLRTLAVATRSVSEAEYEDFVERLQEASQAMSDRDKKVKQVYSHMESGLQLIGAVAVEDKLQDGVTETLLRLESAGMRIWVLTGDKKETAINISFSCGHLQPNMELIDIANQDANTIHNALEAGLAKQKSDLTQVYSLVVDGSTLATIFTYEDNLKMFQQLSDRCQAVICCRMSPLQKAEIVKMIKKASHSPITAAIGDGANDVSMIQEAHVGLGIAGKEGRAAVRSADFAVAKFRYLQKVFLIHGHWYYYRVAILVQYFFYKNVAGFTAQFLFAFFSNFSTNTLYDSVNMTLFNIIFTSLPIFLFGLFEQDVSAKSLLERPELYSKNAKNRLLSLKEFFVWFSEAIWHSIVTFFFFFFFWNYYFNLTSSNALEYVSFGLAIYQASVLVVSLKLLLQSHFWNLFLLLSVGLSLLAFLVTSLVLHGIKGPTWLAALFWNSSPNSEYLKDKTVPIYSANYWAIYHLLASPGVLLATLASAILSLVPDVAIIAFTQSAEQFFRHRRAKGLQTGTESSFGAKTANRNSFENRGFQGSLQNFRSTV